MTRRCVLTYYRKVTFDEHRLNISSVGGVQSGMVITNPTYHQLYKRSQIRLFEKQELNNDIFWLF